MKEIRVLFVCMVWLAQLEAMENCLLMARETKCSITTELPIVLAGSSYCHLPVYANNAFHTDIMSAPGARIPAMCIAALLENRAMMNKALDTKADDQTLWAIGLNFWYGTLDFMSDMCIDASPGAT